MTNVIKTDNALYNTETFEEYEWLMRQLEKAGCKWSSFENPTDCPYLWENFKANTCICVEDKMVTFFDVKYKEYSTCSELSITKVSDMMKTMIKIEKRVDGVFYEEGTYEVGSESFLRALKMLFKTFDIEDIKLTEVD